MNIRFYKEPGTSKWHGDIPGYIEQGATKDQCRMGITGDPWLDIVSQGYDEVTLELSTSPLAEKISLQYEIDQRLDGCGAMYQMDTYDGKDYNLTLWLGPMMLFLFHEYPQIIYYQQIK